MQVKFLIQYMVSRVFNKNKIFARLNNITEVLNIKLFEMWLSKVKFGFIVILCYVEWMFSEKIIFTKIEI